MDPWIISDNDSLAAALCRSLLQHGIECSVSKQIRIAEVEKLGEGARPHGRVVFLALPGLAPEHFELLRRVRAHTDKQIVVVAPPPDHSALLNTMRAGATDYLNANGHLDDEVAEFVTRVRLESSELSIKGRIITVVPCHGPCDGSVLSVNIAAVLAQRAGSCALLDFHLRGGDLSLLLKCTPRHTIYDLVRQSDRLDQNMLRQAMTRHASGIALLAGPPMFSDLRAFVPAVCHRMLAMAQAMHPFAVVNCEDISHDEQIQSLACSDDIIVAMRLDLVSLHRAKQHVDFMVRNRVAPNRVHVVAMGTGHAGELPVSAVREVVGVPAVHLIPDDQGAITISINVGIPIVLESPRSALSRAIIAFVESLPGMDRYALPNGRKWSFLGRAAAALALP